jgi:lipoyl(octanoyl) transferase
MIQVLYKATTGLVSYPDAIKEMDQVAARVRSKEAPNTVWFLEHPHVYTKGMRSDESELLHSGRIPVYESSRGGKFTYHGPGQRIIYLMLNLEEILGGLDVVKYIFLLEECVIQLLKDLNIKAFRVNGQHGVWVHGDSKAEAKKIAFLGVNIRKFVTSHGLAFNLCPNLKHFEGIVPCGIKGCTITSMQRLGVSLSFEDFDFMFKKKFELLFNLSLQRFSC